MPVVRSKVAEVRKIAARNRVKDLMRARVAKTTKVERHEKTETGHDVGGVMRYELITVVADGHRIGPMTDWQFEQFVTRVAKMRKW